MINLSLPLSNDLALAQKTDNAPNSTERTGALGTVGRLTKLCVIALAGGALASKLCASGRSSTELRLPSNQNLPFGPLDHLPDSLPAKATLRNFGAVYSRMDHLPEIESNEFLTLISGNRKLLNDQPVNSSQNVAEVATKKASFTELRTLVFNPHNGIDWSSQLGQDVKRMLESLDMVPLSATEKELLIVDILMSYGMDKAVQQNPMPSVYPTTRFDAIVKLTNPRVTVYQETFSLSSSAKATVLEAFTDQAIADGELDALVDYSVKLHDKSFNIDWNNPMNPLEITAQEPDNLEWWKETFASLDHAYHVSNSTDYDINNVDQIFLSLNNAQLFDSPMSEQSIGDYVSSIDCDDIISRIQTSETLVTLFSFDQQNPASSWQVNCFNDLNDQSRVDLFDRVLPVIDQINVDYADFGGQATRQLGELLQNENIPRISDETLQTLLDVMVTRPASKDITTQMIQMLDDEGQHLSVDSVKGRLDPFVSFTPRRLELINLADFILQDENPELDNERFNALKAEFSQLPDNSQLDNVYVLVAETAQQYGRRHIDIVTDTTALIGGNNLNGNYMAWNFPPSGGALPNDPEEGVKFVLESMSSYLTDLEDQVRQMDLPEGAQLIVNNSWGYSNLKELLQFQYHLSDQAVDQFVQHFQRGDFSQQQDAIQTVIDRLNDNNVLVVFGTGNSGYSGSNNLNTYASGIEGLLAVGSIDFYNETIVAEHTDYGADFIAPQSIYYGTSYSAPVVTAYAAQVWAKNPDWTPKQVEQYLIAVAQGQVDQWQDDADAINTETVFNDQQGNGFLANLTQVMAPLMALS